MSDVLFFRLKGNAHDRRIRYREILREYPYPAFLVRRSAVSVAKTLGNARVLCEETNTPQTIITVQENKGELI